MALNGTRTIIHYNHKGQQTDYIQYAFKFDGNDYIYGNLSERDIAILDKKDGYTEMWKHLETDPDDCFYVDIYKNGIRVASHFCGEEFFNKNIKMMYRKQYCCLTAVSTE